MELKPTIFLDRDGTLLEEVPYLANTDQLRLLPGVPEALKGLQQAGFLLLVVSNQSGVARGLLDEGKLMKIHNKIDTELLDIGVHINGYYHCPHHPTVGIPPQRRRCACRKPHPGLLEQAAQDFKIDWAKSAGVGDSLGDLQAFAAKKLATILVGTGKGRITRQKLAEAGMEPALSVGHLAEAVPWLCRRLNALRKREQSQKG